jgi:hypothetical protein
MAASTPLHHTFSFSVKKFMQTAKSLDFGVFSKTSCFGVDIYKFDSLFYPMS